MKQRKSVRKSSRYRRREERPPESPVSLAITVGWLMSAFTALMAQFSAVACLVLTQVYPHVPLAMFQRLSLFIGLVTGVVAGILLLVARSVRPMPLPNSVVAASLLITLMSVILPWLI